MARERQDSDSIRFLHHTARRTAAILLMEPALNDSYAAVKAGAYPWGGAGRVGAAGE